MLYHPPLIAKPRFEHQRDCYRKYDSTHEDRKGFAVQYGRKKNPINALIYFSNGPYIELLDGTVW